MKKNGQITAFYIETLLLIVVFLAIILVLTQVFGLARQQSIAAGRLTDAVTLAGNAAEAFSAGAGPEELLHLLNENDNAVRLPDKACITAYYDHDRNPDPQHGTAPTGQGSYRVDVNWEEKATETGTMLAAVIEVFCGESGEAVYRLETSSFREVGA